MIKIGKKQDSLHNLFETIYETHCNGVATFIYRMISEKSHVDDLVQDVFLKVHKNIHKLDEHKQAAWVYTITRNVVFDYFRRKKIYAENFVETNEILWEDDEHSPEQLLLNSELNEHLEAAIQNLSPKLKEVFLLRHEAGLKFGEISEMLDCPVNRLLARMHLAVKSIRQQVRQYVKEDYYEL